MRIFANCLEMHNEVKRDLHEMGTQVHPESMQDKDVSQDPMYRTIELSPYAFSIVDASDRDALIRKLGFNLEWCHRDFVERISGLNASPVNPGEAHALRPEWAEFLHDGKFAYTYSERLGQQVEESPGNTISALRRIIGELSARPNTRQAVLPIFRPSDLDNLGGRKRVPCSLQYQFLIRSGKLQMVYNMRSSDFITHFAYDLWHAAELQELMCDALERQAGWLTFFTGSLHIYAKDADQATF